MITAWRSLGGVRWGWFIAFALVLLLWPLVYDTHTPTVLLIWALIRVVAGI